MRQWECQRDGSCCVEPEAVVMTAAEWAELEPHKPQRPVVLDRSREAEGWIALKAAPCPFYSFSDKGCTVYEQRPYNCRRFMCMRWDPAREPFTVSPLKLIRNNNDLRWSFQKNERAHHAWAEAHGWKR